MAEPSLHELVSVASDITPLILVLNMDNLFFFLHSFCSSLIPAFLFYFFPLISLLPSFYPNQLLYSK